MKIFNLILFLVSLTIPVFSQWNNKTIDNNFDEPFKKSFTSINNNGFLAMEVGDKEKNLINIPDSIKSKIINITNNLNIKMGMVQDIIITNKNVIGYISKSACTNNNLDSSINLFNEFLISVEIPKKGLNIYKIFTTAGTYYINESDYLSSGFPGQIDVLYMGDSWVEKNFNEILNLKKLYKLCNIKVIKIPSLYLHGSYFCDNETYIDFVLVVAGINVNYKISATKSKNSEIYFFDDSTWSDEFIKDFKNASKCMIRVNQNYCRSDYYEFNMSGSTSAFNFISK
jgi:hypothetical protein